ncbi:Cytochrome P450 2W1 [Pelobates cultripes]|uniref:Cytochrome P450 2W1, partial n=2 Tax=Pelobates cultripes TaxID=61616 RepID=A0AAD1SQV7_PELCU|nr:Cytochrome P450 2W1 [Pelobates cultripes]
MDYRAQEKHPTDHGTERNHSMDNIRSVCNDLGEEIIHSRVLALHRLLAKKYGNFFTFHLGQTKVVVLVGYDAVKEALVNSNYEFGNRGALPIADIFQHGQGVIFSNGEVWKVTRRFTLSILRDLGMGKRSIEGRIIEELQFLSKFIQSFNGEPFQKNVFNNGPPNIIYRILFGRRFDYSNPTFKKMVELLDDIVILTGSPPAVFYNVFPILKHVLKSPSLVLKKIAELNVILKAHFNEAKSSMSENDWSTYVEAFMQKGLNENKTEENRNIFNEKNLLASMFDLMLGGTETTSTTLQWGFLLMMKYPHIQKKIQDEIDSVIGTERLPQWDDQKNLQYCLAAVHEVQRFGNILQTLAHSTLTDTHFRGYFIPKGTQVIPLFTSVLYDETQWETPYEFNPNHFLDSNGKFLKKDAFFAFSKGRRVCAGESLARMELFIFFTGLLQKFTFHPPPGVDKSDLDLTADTFFTMRPKHYKICATLRQ